MDSDDVPKQVFVLLTAALPALGAAVFSSATAALAALPGARKAALLDSLTGGARQALERYVAHGKAIETRWQLWQVLGVASSALLFSRSLPPRESWSVIVAALCSVATYALTAEVLAAFVEKSPESSSPFLLRLLRPLELLATPLAAPLVWVGDVLGRTQTPRPPAAEVTETEVEMIVAEGEQTGALDHEQSEMIRNVLEFGDVTAGEVMVPRTQVVALDLLMESRDLLQRILEAEHSRYPVYRDQIDNVVGVLHVKDLIARILTDRAPALRLESLMRSPVVFVPESQSASSVLREMRLARQHLAVVIDEFGGMSGIVTLEDLIEEIVGDIRDEHDDDDPAIVELGEGRLLVDASVTVSDLNRHLDHELPEDGDYHSLAGLLVNRLGRVPRAGARLQDFGYEFIVREATERRIAKVEIIPEVANGPSSRQSAA